MLLEEIIGGHDVRIVSRILIGGYKIDFSESSRLLSTQNQLGFVTKKLLSLFLSTAI